MFLLGVITNTGAIILGALIGLVLGKISEQMKTTVLQALGIFIIVLGISMGISGLNNSVVVILSLVIGSIIGTGLKTEQRLEALGKWVESKTTSKFGKVSEAFVFSSLIYCIGSMAILGAIQGGAYGNNEVLYTKSMLDGFTAIIFTSVMGPGVILAAIPVFIYEGIIATVAHLFSSSLNSPVIISEITSVGGIMIVAIGINILEIRKIQIANMLPGLFVAPILQWVVTSKDQLLHIFIH